MTEPSKLSTAQIAAAAGVSHRTVFRWVKLGLLPAPKVVYGLKRGKQSYWPGYAAEQAAWVRAQVEAGRTYPETREALEAGAFRPSTSSPDAGG